MEINTENGKNENKLTNSYQNIKSASFSEKFEGIHYPLHKSTDITNVMTEKKCNLFLQIKTFNESVRNSLFAFKSNRKNNDNKEKTSNLEIDPFQQKDNNIYLKPYKWNDILNKKSEIENDQIFKKLISNLLSDDEAINFKKQLDNLNLTNPECDDKLLFNTIGPLNKYEDDNAIKKIENSLMWRKIKGDGNCFYRSVIFALFENIILSKNVLYLKNLISVFISKITNSDFTNLFDNLKININLVLKCLIMIYLSIRSKSHNPISKAYIIFIKMVNNFKDFDYGLIIFFKYILYEYIEQNKNCTYSMEFPILIGNLLPSDTQDSNGDFDFEKFYKNYLMKFYQYAEKIIIYLTPFIFSKQLLIKYIEEDNGKSVDIQMLEFGNNLSPVCEFDSNSKIELLYKKTHYDLLYDISYYEEFKNILKITLFKFMDINKDNICQLCYINRENKKIKLASLENEKGFKIILCYKCLYKEIKNNLQLSVNFFIQQNKRLFLDNFTQKIEDFLTQKLQFSNKSFETTYANAIKKLSEFKHKYNFEYFIDQIKNEACLFCNRNTLSISNKNKIILPCNCVLCSENCATEFYYTLINSMYIKQKIVCFCNHKYEFDECLLMIEKFNEKKIQCKDLIDFLFNKIKKNECFKCKTKDIQNKLCIVNEPRFVLNNLIDHYICEKCENDIKGNKLKEDNINVNIDCQLCGRPHKIYKIDNKIEKIICKGYNFNTDSEINNGKNNNEFKENENCKKKEDDVKEEEGVEENVKTIKIDKRPVKSKNINNE